MTRLIHCRECGEYHEFVCPESSKEVDEKHEAVYND